jgi:hypothetical protein
MKIIRKIGWKFIEYCLMLPNEVLGIIVLAVFIYITMRGIYDFIV